MTGKNPRVMFMSHEATRTGAPIILLRLVEWLAAQDRYDMSIVSVRRGDLLDSFAAVAPTELLETVVGSGLRQAQDLSEALHDGRGVVGTGTAARVLARARRHQLRRRIPAVKDVDLIYANSVASALAFESLPASHPPIITHVHELGFSLDHLLPSRAWENARRYSCHFIACSHAVVDELHRRGVPESVITLCPEPISVRDVVPPVQRSRLRTERGIDPHTSVVIGSGTRDWRKGVDLFVRVAAKVRRVSPDLNVRFRWIGGGGAPEVTPQLLFDAAHLGVGDMVTFVAPTSTPELEYASGDVLALTSREDPYPLVCVEAALQGIPLVTFESGGAADFARLGAGIVVPYGDVSAMASTIVTLLNDPAHLGDLGGRARSIAHEHDISELGPRIVDAIDRVRA